MLCVNLIGTLKSFLRPVGKQQPPFFLCGEHGGFADRQVASIQFYRGCCPRGIKGQRHYRVFSFFFFVEPLIYSCASHKVNPPSLSLSLTYTHFFPSERTVELLWSSPLFISYFRSDSNNL